MALKELIQEYEELLAEKEGLAERTKANNKAIEEMKEKIANQMVDDDCPRTSYGGYSYSLQEKTKYSKRSDEHIANLGLSFHEVLREQGCGDLIKETVSAQSLQSRMAEIAEQNGGELPDELAEVVNKYDMLDIGRRKETNKTAKKVREKKGE